MPAARLRPADLGRDNAALCALARRCPLGGNFSFSHQRDDFRERGRLEPDLHILVAEEGGALVGCGSVARKPLWVGGRAVPTAYVFDLMVDAPQRGRGLGRSLLRALVDTCPGAGLVYAHVLGDNLASRRLFESEGFRAHPRRVRFHPLVPALEGRNSRAAADPRPVGPGAAAAIDRYLRERYDLVDTTVGHDGLFRIDTAEGLAWAALRRHGPKVAVRVPWHLRALARLVPLVPRPGRPVFAWSLHHVGAQGRRPGAVLDRLLRAVSRTAARQAIDLLLVPLFDGDPLNVPLRRYLLPRWGLGGGSTRLYVRGPWADALFATRRPLLFSGRDG